MWIVFGIVLIGIGLFLLFGCSDEPENVLGILPIIFGIAMLLVCYFISTEIKAPAYKEIIELQKSNHTTAVQSEINKAFEDGIISYKEHIAIRKSVEKGELEEVKKGLGR